MYILTGADLPMLTMYLEDVGSYNWENLLVCSLLNLSRLRTKYLKTERSCLAHGYTESKRYDIYICSGPSKSATND